MEKREVLSERVEARYLDLAYIINTWKWSSLVSQDKWMSTRLCPYFETCIIGVDSVCLLDPEGKYCYKIKKKNDKL